LTLSVNELAKLNPRQRFSLNKNLFALSVIGGILIRAVITGADVTAENKGAEFSFINGGKMRDIHFPHHRHQNTQARQGLLL
jgi:hypothetical protein